MTAGEVALAGGAAAFLLAAPAVFGRWSRRRAAFARLETGASVSRRAVAPASGTSILVRHRAAPFVAGLASALALVLFGLDPAIAAASGLLIGVIVYLFVDWLHRRLVSKIESQLADAVDLIVSSVRAGTGLVDALEGAANEIGRPLRDELSELVTRLRLGDDPRKALAELARAVPLEVVDLLTFTLGVHWQAGGSLADALASIARAIRDRIAIRRRMRAQATEAQLSAFGVLAITYVLALVMWRANPERFARFAATGYGSFLIVATIVLQAVGLLWMSRLTRIEV